MNQTEFTYTIEDDVFRLFPGYVRGVLLAEGVENGESPAGLVSLLRAEEASVRERLKVETVAEHPRMASWREAYRSFGAKPSKYRPSMEAMARRVLKNQEIPSINALVDIGNVVSLRHLVPAGGHAIDVLEGNIALRTATGEESFVPFGSEKEERPLPGEIIFAEGNRVLTRRWTWRQANHTLLVTTTRAVEFNVDGLPPVSMEEVEEACHELEELVSQFCGGRTHYEILRAESPQIGLGKKKEP